MRYALNHTEDGKMNVLIVEDCPVMRLVIIRTLRMSGISVDQIYEAENGMEGLECLEAAEIGLIIADINMPVMDGVEMLERIRANPATVDIPVLTVSTESNEQRIGFIEIYSTDFVHKPFTPEKLRDKILELMEDRSRGEAEVDIN